VTKTADLVVDRTLTGLQASSSVISPNGDGVDDTLTLAFSLTQDVPVRVDIEQSGVVLATVFQGQPGLGPHTLTWDGTANGAPLAAGRYQVVVTVTDGLGDVQFPVTVDVTTG
jgi:flagellar hook assembly protein FlgD